MKTWQIKSIAWAIALPIGVVFWALYLVTYPFYSVFHWWEKRDA